MNAPTRAFGTASATGAVDWASSICSSPGLEWSWKDRDEFDAAYERGMLTKAERDEQLAEAQRMIERVEQRSWPFDEPWPDWRPDPAWPVPHLARTGPRSWRLSNI